MAIQPYQEDDTVNANPLQSKPVKRIRWATQRATGAKGLAKRASIFRRLSKRGGNGHEKKRESSGTDPESMAGGMDGSDGSNEDQDVPARRIFFNLPLPKDARDEDGHPTTHFPRNKIRTAKYTPLSFVPKNLWFQFHNIANIYFFFIIILGVRSNLHSARARAS